VPPSTGRPVSDFAGVLDDAAEAELTAQAEALERDTTIELAVVTVASLEGRSVEEYAERLFNTWGIGQKGKDNGVLVLVAPADRQMRIEVGYGLEGTLPDGLAGRLIREEFLPAFKAGDYSGGVRRGVAAVVARLLPGAPPLPEESGRPDGLSVGGLAAFLGLFVAIGLFFSGAGVGSRTAHLVPWGLLFGGGPLVIGGAPLTPPARAALWLLGAAMFAAGLRAGLRRPDMFRGAGRSGDGWVWGGSGRGGFSGGGGFGGGGFGGGSSGGGGASGRW
jgi:uncharacterized protein